MKRTWIWMLAWAPTLAAPAIAAELPKRAAGLWEEQVSSSSTPGAAHSQRLCVDDKLADFLKSAGAGACSKQDVRSQGGGYLIEAVCRHGDSTSRTRTVITGDLKQAYTAEMNVSYEPPFMGMKQSNMVVKARLLGACPAGMRGGDVIGADGTKFNLHDAGAMPK